MRTVPAPADTRPTRLLPTDYARGLLDGQVDILELVLNDLDSVEDPKTLISALLEHARRRAAELNEAAGR